MLSFFCNPENVGKFLIFTYLLCFYYSRPSQMCNPFPCPPRTTYLVALIRNDFRHCSEHLESIQQNTGNNFTWANHLNILLHVAFYWSAVFSVLWSICMYVWDFFFPGCLFGALCCSFQRIMLCSAVWQIKAWTLLMCVCMSATQSRATNCREDCRGHNKK